MDRKTFLPGFVFLCLGMMINMIVYYTIPDCDYCRVKMHSGEEIEGNCTWVMETLKEEKKHRLNLFTGTKDTENKYRENQKDFRNMTIKMIMNEVKETTTTSLPTTTTTLYCPSPPPCKYTCPECSKCPTCDFELNEKQIHWMLNYKPNFGSAGYQSGGFDCKDDFLKYLDVPGRPKFRSRPSTSGSHIPKKIENCVVSFADHNCDGNFYINNTDGMWLFSGGECSCNLPSMIWVHKK